MYGPVADSALTAIEFPDALDLVSRYAVTAPGASRVRALRPHADFDLVRQELDRVAAFLERLAAGEDVEPVAFQDPAAALGRLRLDGSVLEGHELVAVLTLLAAARTVGLKLRRIGRLAPVLAPLEAPALPASLEKRLSASLEPDGRLRDEASRDLERIRRDLVSVRQDLVRLLERIAAKVAPKGGETAVTVRAGRYVVPVRREARATLGGIVHDESASQSTLFVEPPEAIELNNQLRSLEAAESREVQRILRELTQLLRAHATALEASYAMVVEFDSLYARARWAKACAAVPPRMARNGEAALALRRASHPLLLVEGQTAVPFDLVLENGERTVLISGPNTGGKTVLLKAVGLAVALAQSGVLPPVGPGTVLPVFAGLFADIGDRQSIQESLSTFSSHVAALREVLERADGRSLVLLDELGTGTDPAEGGALAAAILLALTNRGAITLATTHLGQLKELASHEPGISNASLQFDAATLAPTYRFVKGVPGRSYGLAIARRLGLDAAVLEDAAGRVSDEERRLDAALAAAEARGQELERRLREYEAQLAELERERARLALRERELAEQAAQLAAREKDLQRAHKNLRRDALLEARAEVERALAVAREGREKEARRMLEVQIQGSGVGAQGSGGQDDASEPAVTSAAAAALSPDPRSLSPGMVVRIPSLGLEGRIESIRGDDVAVLVRGRRVRVRAQELVA
ncbi:MAG TPA: hypothetical protein VNL98_11935 [Gemmatimonadales bacterium]|nr:hypothetical protein [Gemmatimonadales bacterium]